MSSNNTDCHNGSDNSPNPERAGARIEFRNNKPIFIRPDELEQVLRDLEGPVIIYSLSNQTAYITFLPPDHPPAPGSNDCPCPEGAHLASKGAICRHDPANGKCNVEYGGVEWYSFPCP